MDFKLKDLDLKHLKDVDWQKLTAETKAFCKLHYELIFHAPKAGDEITPHEKVFTWQLAVGAAVFFAVCAILALHLAHYFERPGGALDQRY